MTEADMVKDCLNKLSKESQYKEIIREVPYLCRSIDMVLIDYNNSIISIEFKLKNWKKALKQAQVHNYGADKAYICMPEPVRGFKKNFKDELKREGIGLFKYCKDKKNPLKEIIKPEVNQDKWYPRVKSLQNIINRLTDSRVFAFEN